MRCQIHRSWLLALVAVAGCGQDENLATRSGMIEGSPCPAEWLEAAPPDPSWGLPPTLGDMVPLVMHDVDFVGVYFLAPRAGLQSLLPSSVHPLQVDSTYDLGILSLALYNYKDPAQEGFDPYPEATFNILLEPTDEGYIELFVLALTVTTEETLWVGQQGWGLNKMLGHSHCRAVKPKGIKCMAESDGMLIAAIEVDTYAEPAVPFSAPYVAVSVKDDQLVRAPLYFTGSITASFVPGVDSIHLGEHPLGQTLKSIGVGSFPSAGHAWGTGLDTWFGAGYCTPL